MGALDNLDHNPTATTSQGSFHGTGISLFQLPTSEVQGTLGDKFSIAGISGSEQKLPESYSTVPAVSCKPSDLAVPATATATATATEMTVIQGQR